MTKKEIAVQLNLSEFIVRNHNHRTMKEVDVGFAVRRSEGDSGSRIVGASTEQTSIRSGLATLQADETIEPHTHH